MTYIVERSTQPEPRDATAADRLWTVPNVLSVVRLVGSLVLVPLAVYEWPVAFLITYLALTATDWIDGKLARWLGQVSKIGPKLDSASDVTMYTALLFGLLWLFGDALLGEAVLIATAAASYAISCLVSLLKFHRLPTYHTRAAKISWFVVLAAVVALFLDWSIWPLRLAAVTVLLTNLEATLITFVLPRAVEDLPSLYHALRIRRES